MIRCWKEDFILIQIRLSRPAIEPKAIPEDAMPHGRESENVEMSFYVTLTDFDHRGQLDHRCEL